MGKREANMKRQDQREETISGEQRNEEKRASKDSILKEIKENARSELKSKAEKSKAGQAEQRGAKQSKTEQCKAEQSDAKRSNAKQSKAKRSNAEQSKA